MTSSASRCSSTTTARRPTARAPAAPARTSTTPARSPSGIGIPHYVLDYESRFKEAVIDRFAASYVAGETPVPCVDCNMSIKFKDLLVDRARSRRARAGDRPLRREPAVAGRRPRALSRPRGRARPELFPVRHHARAARLPALSARRHDQGGDARAGAALRAAGRRQARQPGHLLRADRPLHRHDRAACGRAPPIPATSSISPARCSAATTASSISRSASGAASASPPGSRSTWCSSTPRPGASSSARARRCAAAACSCATSTGSATARSTQALADDRREVFVKVRSTRPPQPAWLRRSAAAAGRGRGRAGRRRGRRFARAGLRLLRRAGRPVAGSGRRIHPECGRSGPRPAAGGGAGRPKPALIGSSARSEMGIKKYFMTTPHKAASFDTMAGRDSWIQRQGKARSERKGVA